LLKIEGSFFVKYVYPAIFRPEEEGGFCVIFPDIRRGATQGDDMIDAIEMAEDFLSSVLYDIEEEKSVIPTPSDTKTMQALPNEIVTLVVADTGEYRRYKESRVIKKTLTLPSWLNARAEAASVNFSQILQRALKEELQIAE
jgi:predicted RNase H-like HicB family nuclease